MKQTTTLSLSNVSKRFGDIEAVHDLSFTIGKGDVVGFVGPNGAGKTTTISMLMGYIAATKGTLKLLGTEITPESAHDVHARLGYVAGDMVLPGQLTAEQFLTFISSKNGRDIDRYNHLLTQLDPVIGRPIKTLSRGNRQKIALIAALQHDPDILILDEPTSGLDPLMQDVFLKVVAHAAKRGTTVLMSSHILSEVSSVCSRIIFMKNGKSILDKQIGAITNQLGKHIIITTHDAAKLAKYMPREIELISKTPTSLRVATQPENLKSFLRWLVTKEFSDIVIEERNIDDVFHELYMNESPEDNRT